MKNAAIVVLCVLVVWLSVRVVELENFRYAVFVGLCSETPKTGVDFAMEHYNCLKEQQTRTTSIWHLFYALVDGV